MPTFNPRRIVFAVYKGVSLLDLAGPLEAFPLKKAPWEEVVARDAKRLQRVRVLLDAGRITTAQDQVYAAFIFQHGKSADDFALAHVLASAAATKGQPAPQWARWLAAAVTIDD